MLSTDFHQRYHHSHYVFCCKVHVGSNGEIEVHSGNVCLILTPDELQAMIDGIKEFSRVYSSLSERDTSCIEQ